jgi:hypothetical protein
MVTISLPAPPLADVHRRVGPRARPVALEPNEHHAEQV